MKGTQILLYVFFATAGEIFIIAPAAAIGNNFVNNRFLNISGWFILSICLGIGLRLIAESIKDRKSL